MADRIHDVAIEVLGDQRLELRGLAGGVVQTGCGAQPQPRVALACGCSDPILHGGEVGVVEALDHDADAALLVVAATLRTAAAACGDDVPAQVDAPVQVVTRENVAQAQARYPAPVEHFDDPFAP